MYHYVRYSRLCSTVDVRFMKSIRFFVSFWTWQLLNVANLVGNKFDLRGFFLFLTWQNQTHTRKEPLWAPKVASEITRFSRSPRFICPMGKKGKGRKVARLFPPRNKKKRGREESTYVTVHQGCVVPQCYKIAQSEAGTKFYIAMRVCVFLRTPHAPSVMDILEAGYGRRQDWGV